MLGLGWPDLIYPEITLAPLPPFSKGRVVRGHIVQGKTFGFGDTSVRDGFRLTLKRYIKTPCTQELKRDQCDRESFWESCQKYHYGPVFHQWTYVSSVWQWELGIFSSHHEHINLSPLKIGNKNTTYPILLILFYSPYVPVLGIRDMLVRIQILWSVPLTNGSGCGTMAHLHHSSKIKKKSQRSYKTLEIKVFLTIFAWWWKDPDPYLWLTDPDADPRGLKTYGSYCSDPQHWYLHPSCPCSPAVWGRIWKPWGRAGSLEWLWWGGAAGPEWETKPNPGHDKAPELFSFQKF